MAKYKRKIDKSKSILDNETGEVLGHVVNTVYIKPENFAKLFMDSIDALVSVNPRSLQVLMVAVKYATFTDTEGEPGSYFHNDLTFKQHCIRLIKPTMDENSINTHIHNLYDAGIIERTCRGTYRINPTFLIKGKTPNLHY